MAKKAKTAARTKGGQRKLHDGLDRAHALIDRRQWRQAANVLDALQREHPQNQEVLSLLVNVAIENNDRQGVLNSCDKWYALCPNHPDLPFTLAAAYLANSLPGLALTFARRAVSAFPHDERAAEMREIVTKLEPIVAETIKQNGFAGEDGLECVVLHEQVRVRLGQGRVAKAAELARTLIERQPRFAPGYNNAADACFHDGRLSEAVELTQRLLAFQPDHIYALGNLVRFQLALAQRDAARASAERLKALRAGSKDHAVKQAEALILIGETAAALAVCEGASTIPGHPSDDALVHHLAAVAAYRLGRVTEAAESWRLALRAEPHLTLARDNLDDLKRPAGERNAPWLYPVQTFVAQKLIRGLYAGIDGVGAGKEDAARRREAVAYAAAHPELEGLLPVVLEFSDGPGRAGAVSLATLLGTPAALAALRDFALSKWGSDKLRFEAALVAKQGGLFPDGIPEIQVAGADRGATVRQYEIHSEQVRRCHAAGVEPLIVAAVQALSNDDALGAAATLRRAQALDPNDPVVLNNLAAAYGQLGRMDEAAALIRRAFDVDQDYLFSRTALANLATLHGELERARELLAPLMERKRFHVMEFAALCVAKLNVHLAAQEREPARHWLQMLREMAPHHPAIESYERKLSGD